MRTSKVFGDQSYRSRALVAGETAHPTGISSESAEQSQLSHDKLLLERAAKAAGIDLTYDLDNGGPVSRDMHGGGVFWNPLESDADAFSLGVRCDVLMGLVLDRAEYTLDPYAATRRAIVRAAASMGEKQ